MNKLVILRTITAICSIILLSCTIQKKESNRLNTSVYLYNEQADSIELKSLIQNKSLFLLYSKLNCMSCIEEIIKEINRDTLNSTKIAIISSYDNIRYVNVFKRVNHIKGKVYNDVRNEIIGLWHPKELPCLIKVDSKGAILSEIFLDNKNYDKIRKVLYTN